MKMHAFFVSALLITPMALAENWPQWRGPSFNGSSTEANLPDRLDPASNLLWSAAMPGNGAGTPIVWGDRVFVSAQEKGSQKLVGLCYDSRQGQLLWKREVGLGSGSPPGRMNDMASPSAVADGQRVIFYFGTGDLAAFDFGGRPLWARNIQKDHGNFNIQYLYGSSPLLYENKLYIPVLHRDQPYGGRRLPVGAESYLLAVNADDGKDVFKHIRPQKATGESKESYCTPIPFEGGGKRQVVLVGGDCVTGHDPATGDEFWRCGGWNDRHFDNLRIVPSVVAAGDLLIACSPKVRGQIIAIKSGGSGLVTDTHIAWRNTEIKSDVCTPLFYQGNLYVLDGDFNKALNCVDPANGHVKWSTPIRSRPVLRASPTGADGKIYFMNEAAEIWVLSADDGKILSQTSLESDGRARASISVSQGRVYVRTSDKLFCFGSAKP